VTPEDPRMPDHEFASDVPDTEVIEAVDDRAWVDPGVDDDDLTLAARAAAEAEFGDLDALLEEWSQPDTLLPSIAVVGRPNVGKSTLVNRIIGRREAVVEDVPGVTRDRVVYQAEWAGKDFLLIDTGGWQRDARGLAAQIAAQAERAIAEADAVMFVVDAAVGALDEDSAVVKVLRDCGLPILLVANKVDDQVGELEATSLWSLGLGEPYPVSALHGRGSGDLLDAVVAVLPEEGRNRTRGTGPRRVALLGKPNVGKSSLLNQLAGESRAVVDSVAGTTVDPVDELIVLSDREWWFVDTAGIRRRVKEASGHEYYASLRTRAALEKAEVALVLIDGSEPLSEQDLRILSLVVETGRALVIAYNKWDLVDEDRRRYLDKEIDRELHQVRWAPRVNVSALTGRHMNRLVPALDEALGGWEMRIPTSTLNAFLAALVAAHPHPVRGGRQPRILFGTQAATRPPTFVLFTTGFLEAGYRRFIERRLREEFGFAGSPIRINLRVREKRRGRR
jgi:GTP-binding protein